MVLQEAFDGTYVAQNFLRLFIVGVGIFLAMLSLRFAWLSWARRGERYRAYGILSFGFIVITPALSGLHNFGEPINWWSTTAYFIGMVLGLVAIYANYRIAPPWWRLGGRRRETPEEREAKRHGDDGR